MLQFKCLIYDDLLICRKSAKGMDVELLLLRGTNQLTLEIVLCLAITKREHTARRRPDDFLG